MSVDEVVSTFMELYREGKTANPKRKANLAKAWERFYGEWLDEQQENSAKRRD